MRGSPVPPSLSEIVKGLDYKGCIERIQPRHDELCQLLETSMSNSLGSNLPAFRRIKSSRLLPVQSDQSSYMLKWVLFKSLLFVCLRWSDYHPDQVARLDPAKSLISAAQGARILHLHHLPVLLYGKLRYSALSSPHIFAEYSWRDPDQIRSRQSTPSASGRYLGSCGRRRGCGDGLCRTSQFRWLGTCQVALGLAYTLDIGTSQSKWIAQWLRVLR